MDSAELAPEIESILATAREREGSDHRVSVAARSLPRALRGAATAGRRPVIAEVKPTSPTTGGTHDADPVAIAEAMVAGGAAALSVLTEPDHFGGSPETLRRVREAVEVPVLRKDFLVEKSQLDVIEADLVLLIARFVDDLDGLMAAARDRGFQVLVEVHTRAELDRALAAGASIVGINNRDLVRLEVNLDTFEAVAPGVPEEVTLLAESGIGSPKDAARMRAAGADGLLIGSAIMDADPEVVAANTRELTGMAENDADEAERARTRSEDSAATSEHAATTRSTTDE